MKETIRRVRRIIPARLRTLYIEAGYQKEASQK